jgi:hypothetical protein
MEPEQLSLPFQTVSRGGVTYKLFGVVTNLDWGGDDVIRFHDGRCGKCEEAHKVLKEDFAGGKMPSNEFGANAAWWQIAVLAMNTASAMKRVVLKANPAPNDAPVREKRPRTTPREQRHQSRWRIWVVLLALTLPRRQEYTYPSRPARRRDGYARTPEADARRPLV